MTRKTKTATRSGLSVPLLLALFLASLFTFLTFTPHSALAREATALARAGTEMAGENSSR